MHNLRMKEEDDPLSLNSKEKELINLLHSEEFRVHEDLEKKIMVMSKTEADVDYSNSVVVANETINKGVFVQIGEIKREIEKPYFNTKIYKNGEDLVFEKAAISYN